MQVFGEVFPQNQGGAGVEPLADTGVDVLRARGDVTYM